MPFEVICGPTTYVQHAAIRPAASSQSRGDYPARTYGSLIRQGNETARLDRAGAGHFVFGRIECVAISSSAARSHHSSATRSESCTYAFTSSREFLAPCTKTTNARSNATPMAVPPRNFIGYTTCDTQPPENDSLIHRPQKK